MYQLLQGMRILDLTRLLPGGYATQLLGDLGAEVLKVEDPWQGDYMRWMDPCFEGTGESALFWGLNRNKKSMRLNLKSQAGRELFLRLVQQYDIVIEGFRPGVMDSLGLGYEKLKQVNPAVIMCSISGYGQTGPYKSRSGHDINYTSIAGSLGLTGQAGGKPVIPSVQIADLGGGALTAAVGVLAAVISRQSSGLGQYIDVSMLDGVVSWMTMLFMQLAAQEPTLQRGKVRLSGGVPCYNVYRTRDGKFMSLGALEEKFWREFCQVVRREDLIAQQFSSDPATQAEVENIFLTRTRDEWTEFFAHKDICCEPVLEPHEVKEHPQVVERKLFAGLPHPRAGNVEVAGTPIKFTGCPQQADLNPPGFGEHTKQVLLGLGMDESAIAALAEAGII